MSDNCSVKVAVRVRPLDTCEIQKGCKEIIDIIPENDQILIHEKTFTFNYVFGPESSQDEVYHRSVSGMITNLFKGYNVTILAYGQTGSGKTHSMGTAYKEDGDMGVIPRAIQHIFDYITDNLSLDCNIKVSFVELYQEMLYDLLAGKPREQCVLDIREDVSKGNYIPGLTQIPVVNARQVIALLAQGSIGRVTGSTNMNSQSSRSHAIFTLNISIHHKSEDGDNNITAKLHLVDLAGSERPKKTGAVGNTFKEGCNINKGLFVLGNVISCLGDENKAGAFVPYRDSNLTRLLKDSLGGNSITLMIACVSPADYNSEETVSTLRYADRAKQIKNKPVINQDPHIAQICKLKSTIQQLRLQIVEQGGPVAVCPADIEDLKRRNANLEKDNRELNVRLSAVMFDNTGLLEKLNILQNHTESMSNHLNNLTRNFQSTTNNLNEGLENNNTELVKTSMQNLFDIQKKFEDMNNEQKKTVEDIKYHEESFAKLINAPDNFSEINVDFDEQQTEFTSKQVALNTELQECMKQLARKEGLAQQLIRNVQYMVDYNGLAQNEEKINSLQKEKDELLQQLKAVQSQDNVGKLAEQRRKRLKELETQIQDLQKKVAVQSRLIKHKEKDEKMIRDLGNEILNMKQNKVKLMKKIREESEKFREWRIQRERELAKLKQQDRKKDNEIVKIKLRNAKQQNVLRRKVEEANALNKRLQQALQKRTQGQEGKNDKAKWLRHHLKEELEIFFSFIEAEETVINLLEDRGKLQEQLEILRSNPETVGSEECKNLEEDIECRSAQISDFQNKIMESDDDNKLRARFENIQSMSDAKQTLRLLFEHATDIKRKAVQSQLKLTETHEITAEVRDCKKNYEDNMRRIEEKYDKQLSELQNSYEEKISLLLRQLCGVKVGDGAADDELKGRYQLLVEEYSQLEERATELQRQLDHYKNPVSTEAAGTSGDSKKIKSKAVHSDETLVKKHESEKENLDSSVEQLLDDDKKDPDWRRTPLG
ncbi:chromosome-associated kinesin KIF4-like isoform X2 [Aethina tumida]|nr:chromosome-associated kinesin KIF4-like isoform X2 [Aethina tumida]